MKWDSYKTAVSSSRAIIAFPFFAQHVEKLAGIGIDLGCGDGELTAHLAAKFVTKYVGVDISSEYLDMARRRSNKDIHYVQGDIEKNFLPTLGIEFDFAISNCCFSHISNEGIYNILFDLHSCMKDGGQIAFLVPSIRWAREMYSNIENVPSGITAIPRFGGRQAFRIPEWYISALASCGFELVCHEELLIPDDNALDERYVAHAGKPLFSAFVAKKLRDIPGIESIRKAFDIAHDNRKFEIGLFWQRSLFFWGFVATALVGYGAAYGKSSTLSILFALFGLVCSIVWSAGNRGSKYWQEYWEEKVNFYQHQTTGNIFFDRKPKTPGIFENFAARRISVSKLTMALSDYMVILWFILCLYTLGKQFYRLPTKAYAVGQVGLVLLTLIYCLWFLRYSKSED